MATKLSLFDDALLLCGERALSSLTEVREPRRLLDQVWSNGGVNYCLSQGLWHFALRSVQLDYDTNEDPQIGLNYAFSTPSDWLTTAAICADEYFRDPMTEYVYEGGYWYADISPIYVRYVSSGLLYGGNIADWPVPFKEYCAAHFASKIVRKVTGDKDRVAFVVDEVKRTKHEAKSNGLMSQPTVFYPEGRWVRHRRGRMNREGGNRNGPLIG